MHLQAVYRLLLATTEQPYGFLKIADPRLENDVREMVELGLVDATIGDGRETTWTAINRVTNEGQRFMRVFEEENCAVLRVYRRRKQEAVRVLEEVEAAGRKPLAAV